MNVLDLLYPKKCLECSAPGVYLCSSCLNRVGAGLYRKTAEMEGVISVWSYEGVIRKAIIALKYKFISDLAGELAERTVNKLLSYKVTKLPKNPVLVPVPLHPVRTRWRGFNQAEVLGKLIAKSMNWGFDAGILIKNVAGKPQVGLKGDERRSNIRNVFSLNPNYNLPTTPYNLILFDDVYTTGSTLNEAARVLRKTGAGQIWGLTIAG